MAIWLGIRPILYLWFLVPGFRIDFTYRHAVYNPFKGITEDSLDCKKNEVLILSPLLSSDLAIKALKLKSGLLYLLIGHESLAMLQFGSAVSPPLGLSAT